VKTRTWVRSGISEDLDQRQQRLLDLVLDAIRRYYSQVPAPTHALSLSRLMRLCNRNSLAVTLAVKILSHTVEEGQRVPLVWYERVPSVRHPAKRYYRITLR
jgi:hypothetical protein